MLMIVVKDIPEVVNSLHVKRWSSTVVMLLYFPAFTGAGCECQVDFCAKDGICQNDGLCSADLDGYKCECQPGKAVII